MSKSQVVTIDQDGITKPSFETVHEIQIDKYKKIFGADVYVEVDSQDGQSIAIRSAAIDEVNSANVAVYNSFRPDFAQGAGLSSLVKINGIARKIPSFSKVDVTLVGQFGTIITNGAVTDENSNKWILPASVTIPMSGQITVTATAEYIGAVRAPAGTIDTIATPVRGWQAVFNQTAAAPGDPVESDAELRARQKVSTMIPSNSSLDGLIGAISGLPTIGRFRIYENDGWGEDSYKIPGKSIAVVVEGGMLQEVADTIRVKKPVGVATYGTQLVTSIDAAGIERPIYISRLREVKVAYYIKLQARNGFTENIQERFVSELVKWTNELGIGNELYLEEARVPLFLWGDSDARTYKVLSFLVARDGDEGAPDDIGFAYNEIAMTRPAYVALNIVTPNENR